MDTLNSDLIFQMAQYLSVLDAASLMKTSQRYYYLVHHLRRVLGPEMVGADSDTPVQTALKQLRQRPTLALCCSTDRSTLNERVASHLPPSTVVLGAMSSTIQTCLDQRVDANANANILLGNLGKDASIQPFLWQSHEQHALEWEGEMEQEVKDAFPPSTEYEVFLIYGCGDGCGVLEEFVDCVQSLHPNAALVGGICSGGYVSKPVDPQQLDRGVLGSKRVAVLKQMYKNLGGDASVLKTLTEKQTLVEFVHGLLRKSPYVLEPHLEDAVFGVALGGNVPIRSVVSRGVKKLSPPDTTWLVQEARLLGPTLGQTMEARTMAPPFHVLESIVDPDTGKELSLMGFLASASQGVDSCDFCGIRRRIPGSDNKYEDSFELYAMDLHGDKLKIPVHNSDLFSGSARAMSMSHSVETASPSSEGKGELDQAQVEFFAMNGQACVEHVESTMRQLKKQADQNNDNVLAAIMYSCGGRGPYPGWLIHKRMADATAFSEAFGGEVPCIGFYAGGEIGPLATAPAPNTEGRNLFQRGKAALQGFTAVFALFIAPEVNLRQADIDDSPEHVSDFISKHLTPQQASSS